jgi:hypothetical protein
VKEWAWWVATLVFTVEGSYIIWKIRRFGFLLGTMVTAVHVLAVVLGGLATFGTF